MPININKGAGLALDRIMRTPTIEQIEGVPEPEQLERRPAQLSGVRLPQRLLSQSTGIQPTMSTVAPVSSRLPPARLPSRLREQEIAQPTGFGAPPEAPPEEAPAEPLPESTDFTITDEEGVERKLTLKTTDRSVWEGDIKLGSYDENDDFQWVEPTVGQKLANAAFTGIEAAFSSFTMAGMTTRKMGTEGPAGVVKMTATGDELQLLSQELISGQITGEEYEKEKEDIIKRMSGEVEEYKARPWWEQLLWELPALVVSGAALPGGALSAWRAAGKLPTALRIAVRAPIAPFAGLEKGAGLIIKAPFQGFNKAFWSIANKAKPEVRKLGEWMVKGGADEKLLKRVDRLLKRAAEGENVEKAILSLEKQLGQIGYKAPTAAERASWKALGLTVEDAKLLELLSPQLRKLHIHPARLKGFSKASYEETADFLYQLRKEVAKRMPDRLGLVDEAMELGAEDRLGATVASERALGYLHMDELAEIRAIEEVAGDVLQLPGRMALRVKPQAFKQVQELGSRLRIAVNEVRKASDDELKQKLLGFMDEAQATWSKIKAARRPFMKDMAGAYADALESAKGKGYVGFKEAASAMAGKRPDIVVEALEKSFTPKEISRIFDMVIESTAIKPLSKRPLSDALIDWFLSGKVPRPNIVEKIEKVFGKEFADQMRTRGLMTKIADVLNVPRALLASADMSAVLRQNILLTFGHPVKASRATVDMFKAAFSPENYRVIDAGIRSNPYFDYMIKKGFDYLGVGETGLARRAEPYMTTLAQKIPIVGSVIRWSERGFVTYSNKIRSDIFYGYANQFAGKKGGGIIMKDIANILNVLGGRGTMSGQLEKAAPFLSTFLFSPRLQVARLQLPFKMILPRSMGGVGAVAKKEAIRDVVAFLAPTLSTLMLLDATGAAKVDWDVNSTDFLKIKIGNVRIDPWGGFQQWVKLLIRISTGLRRTQDGELIEIDRLDEMINFIRTKLSPAVSLATDLLKGETIIGDEMFETEKLGEQFYNRLTPMFIQDVIEAMGQEGMLGGFAATPGFFGVGIQAYAPRGFEEWQESVGEKVDISDKTEELSDEYNEAVERWFDYQQLPKGKTRERYRENNPEIEADLYFWGEVSSVSTPEAWEIVKAKLQEYGLPESTVPIRKTEESYETRGKDVEEVFADLVDMVPTSLSNYIWENEEAWKAKDLAALMPLVQQMKESDRTLLDKYTRMAMGEDTRFMAAFRRDNPEVDAALLFWKGYKQPYSRKALELLRQKADQLGIPYSVIPALAGGTPQTTQPAGAGIGSLLPGLSR